MGNKKFLVRLKKELPAWVQRGWLTPGADRAILDHVAAQDTGTPYLTYAFSLLGVLLLGSGVITYFAANWGDIPKLVKLVILFGSMWIVYGAAWHALRDSHAPLLGKALLLLGVILYGSNIMLIAQVYHIDAHFPNGVLLWSIGALVAAYLAQSQPALVAAIALGWLWTTLEHENFWSRSAAHWPFLILWVSFLPLIWRHHFRAALHVALIALLFWSLYAYGTGDFVFGGASRKVYLVQFFFLAYLTVFLLGMVCATYDRFTFFAGPLQRYGAFAVLTSAWALTFPYLQSGRWSQYASETRRLAASGEWLALTFIALALVVTVSFWHRARTISVDRPAYLRWGQGLIGAIVILLIANLFFGGHHGGAVAIAFNLAFFAGLIWLIYAGMHTGDRFLVNIAFVFFGLTLLARYFDTFWTLLNRSYFFMIGGLLLIAGGYLMERKRRQISADIRSREHGGRVS